MISLETILVLLALLGAATIGGVFFAFSSFVMGALARITPAAGIAAMQSINVVVLNVSFLGTFFGTAALSVAVLFVDVAESGSIPDRLASTGAMLYLVGTFLVTARGNVPLNNRLANVAADDVESVAVWEDYLKRWTRLNTVRTVAALSAVACFATSLSLAG